MNKQSYIYFIALSFLIIFVGVAVAAFAQVFKGVKINLAPENFKPRALCDSGSEAPLGTVCPSFSFNGCLDSTDQICDFFDVKFCIPRDSSCTNFEATNDDGMITIDSAFSYQKTWCMLSPNPGPIMSYACEKTGFVGCYVSTDTICSFSSYNETAGKEESHFRCTNKKTCKKEAVEELVTSRGYTCFDKSQNRCVITTAELGKYATEEACKAECVSGSSVTDYRPKKAVASGATLGPTRCLLSRDNYMITESCVPQTFVNCLNITDSICELSDGNIACLADCTEFPGSKPLARKFALGITLSNTSCLPTLETAVQAFPTQFYDTLEECQNPPKNYACVDKTKKLCQRSSKGPYKTQRACLKECKEISTPEVSSPVKQDEQKKSSEEGEKFSCVDQKKHRCVEDAEGSYTDRGVCEVFCAVTPTEEKMSFSCFNKEKRQCEPEKGGKYVSLEACQSVCVPIFQDEASCKAYYKRTDVQMKALRKLCESYDPGNLKDTEILISACLSETEKLRQEFKSPKCTDVGFGETVLRLVQLDKITVGLEDLNLPAKQERLIAPSAPSYQFPEALRERAEREFDRRVLENPNIAPLIEKLFTALSFIREDDLKLTLENLGAFVKERYQESLANNQDHVIEKVREIFEAYPQSCSEEDREAFEKALSEMLKPLWDEAILEEVDIKTNQLKEQLKKGKCQVTSDLGAFVEDQEKRNNEILYDRGIIKFKDTHPHRDWFFAVFHDPKQIAFKGDGQGNAKPTTNIRKSEALLALLRTYLVPGIEVAECSPQIPASITDYQDWNSCAIHVAVKEAEDFKDYLSGSMSEDISRELLSTWIWKFGEVFSPGKLKAPKSLEEAKSLVTQFQDLEKYKNNELILKGVATVVKSGIAKGRKPDQFGTGTALRAEIAKMFLELQKILRGV